jgi:hypothetical protein
MHRIGPGLCRVFRYLNYSKRLKLCHFDDPQDMALIGYSDSDYAGDATDRRCTMGYMFLLHGAAVTWAARKQQSISTTTTEAEYTSGSATPQKKPCGLANCLEIYDAGDTPEESVLCASMATTRVLCDSLGTQSFTPGRSTSMYSTTMYASSKSLGEKRGGVIDVEYVSTEEMVADCLTKPLKRQKFTANLKTVGLYEDTDGGVNRQTQSHAEWECCE